MQPPGFPSGRTSRLTALLFLDNSQEGKPGGTAFSRRKGNLYMSGRPKRPHDLRVSDGVNHPVVVTVRDSGEQARIQLDRAAYTAALEAAGNDHRRVVRNGDGGYDVVNEPIWGHNERTR